VVIVGTVEHMYRVRSGEGLEVSLVRGALYHQTTLSFLIVSELDPEVDLTVLVAVNEVVVGLAVVRRRAGLETEGRRVLVVESCGGFWGGEEALEVREEGSMDELFVG